MCVYCVVESKSQGKGFEMFLTDLQNCNQSSQRAHLIGIYFDQHNRAIWKTNKLYKL